MSDYHLPFAVSMLSLARAIATSGPHRIWNTESSASPKKRAGTIRIGFFGNMANNHYCAVKALRKIGVAAELVLEDTFIDNYLMNRPFWQDLCLETATVEDAYVFEKEWRQPTYVHKKQFDPSLASKFSNTGSYGEVQALYKQHFGQELAADLAVLLTQHMGYWPYLQAFRQFDICLFSSAAIPLAVFCPKPFIVIPSGGDINLMPYWETVSGFLTRGAYTRADAVFSLSFYAESIRRLSLSHKTLYIPFINAPDSSETGESSVTIRKRWGVSKNSLCILCGCRQNWEWKGNDLLLRAFARFTHPSAYLILAHWGQDLEKTKKYIDELGISTKVFWEPVSSRPLLFQKMQAADVVCDQFVMDGFGTTIVESLCAGTPVIAREQLGSCLPGQNPPPILPAKSEDDILQHLQALSSQKYRNSVGCLSKKWAMEERYSPALAQQFLEQILQTVNARL